MYYRWIHSNTLVVQVCITKISIVSKCITIKNGKEIKKNGRQQKIRSRQVAN